MGSRRLCTVRNQIQQNTSTSRQKKKNLDKSFLEVASKARGQSRSQLFKFKSTKLTFNSRNCSTTTQAWTVRYGSVSSITWSTMTTRFSTDSQSSKMYDLRLKRYTALRINSMPRSFWERLLTRYLSVKTKMKKNGRKLQSNWKRTKAPVTA